MNSSTICFIQRDKRRRALGTFKMRIEFQHERPMAVIECRMQSIAMSPPREKKGDVLNKFDRCTITQISQKTILAVAEKISR
jgi:hypothetical protein